MTPASTAAPTGTPIPREASIVLVRPDGTDERTVKEGDVGGALWSPSGAQLAIFEGGSDLGSDITILDVDSGETRTVAEDVRIIGDVRHDGASFEWAPDERQIAATLYDPEKLIEGRGNSAYEVYVFRVEGDAVPRRIANGRSPSWSADSRYLAFVGNWCQPEGGFDVMVLDTQTDTLRTVSPPELDISSVTFSPTSQEIAFHTLQLEPFIYTVRPDGSQLQRHSTSDNSTEESNWSPDGRYIAFMVPGSAHGICD